MVACEGDELKLVAQLAELLLEGGNLLLGQVLLPVEGGGAVVGQALAGELGVDTGCTGGGRGQGRGQGSGAGMDGGGGGKDRVRAGARAQEGRACVSKKRMKEEERRGRRGDKVAATGSQLTSEFLGVLQVGGGGLAPNQVSVGGIGQSAGNGKLQVAEGGGRQEEGSAPGAQVGPR